ncbi:MAG TPA: molybdate ABC transporter substrate-binding protein [Candidatus Acidoferrum sp.]|nr:molybdate ABC transporter substrate-binding protein [Candidatus Acidoferrum sp.]
MTSAGTIPWACRTIFLCLQAFSAFTTAARPQTKEVRIAAAADLKFAMQDLATVFEKQTGITVAVTYGSSGNFFSQLQSGAPFDVFFSADTEYAERLDAAGLGEPGTLSVYAIGRLAVWMPATAGTDLAHRGWNALLDAGVQRVSVANPKHAPYGMAAVAALRRAGIYDRVKAKLIFGEDVSQAAQFVESGNAQAGIIAMSFAVSPAMRAGEVWEIPANGYPPIKQAAIVMKGSPNRRAARMFLEFVREPRAAEILAKDGFALPSSTSARRARQ